jgi:hypothetical protein
LAAGLLVNRARLYGEPGVLMTFQKTVMRLPAMSHRSNSMPAPLRRLIGDMSNENRILVGWDLAART